MCIIIIITFIKINATADGSNVRCGWLHKMASCHYTCAAMLLWYSVCNCDHHNLDDEGTVYDRVCILQTVVEWMPSFRVCFNFSGMNDVYFCHVQLFILLTVLQTDITLCGRSIYCNDTIYLVLCTGTTLWVRIIPAITCAPICVILSMLWLEVICALWIVASPTKLNCVVTLPC